MFAAINIVFVSCILTFKGLEFFFTVFERNEISYTHQGCICLVTNTVKNSRIFGIIIIIKNNWYSVLIYLNK